MSTIFRIEKNRDYVVMNNKFLRNKEMSLKAKGALSLFLSLPDNWQYSINGLAAICKESQTAIRSTLKELEEHRHLKRLREQDEKGQFKYVYCIYEIPYDGNEYADDANAENGRTENRRQQSIQKKNIKEKSINKENIDIYAIDNYLDILNTIGDDDLRELYIDFLEHRKYMGDPLTKRGLELLRERVRELVGLNVAKQKQLLKTSLINNWKNVYLKDEPGENEQIDDLKSFYLGED